MKWQMLPVGRFELGRPGHAERRQAVPGQTKSRVGARTSWCTIGWFTFGAPSVVLRRVVRTGDGYRPR